MKSDRNKHLFRQKAIDHLTQTDTLANIQLPIQSLLLWSVCLIGALLTFFYWLLCGTLEETLMAYAIALPKDIQIIQLYSPHTGIVRKVFKHTGEFTVLNELLIEIENPALNNEINALNNKKRYLKESLACAVDYYDRLKNSIQNHNLQKFDALLRSDYMPHLEALRLLLQKHFKLYATKHLSLQQLLNKETEWLSINERFYSSQINVAELEQSQIARIEHQREQISFYRQQLNSISAALEHLLEQQESLKILSPINGRIQEIFIFDKQRLNKNDLLLTILSTQRDNTDEIQVFLPLGYSFKQNEIYQIALFDYRTNQKIGEGSISVQNNYPVSKRYLNTLLRNIELINFLNNRGPSILASGAITKKTQMMNLGRVMRVTIVMNRRTPLQWLLNR